MIVVYILVMVLGGAQTINPIPPMGTLASCERVKAALPYGQERATCVQVVIPATADKAHLYMSNRIEGEPK